MAPLRRPLLCTTCRPQPAEPTVRRIGGRDGLRPGGAFAPAVAIGLPVAGRMQTYQSLGRQPGPARASPSRPPPSARCGD
jgi:hypothetical protein